jgi:putative SOS response-associated peptidase YedK
VPIVRMTDGDKHFALVRWGLIPPWVKDPRGFTLLINARGESLDEKPAFRAALRYRRCLFPADGFYDWRRQGERARPYYVRLKAGGAMAFAGLWENWMGPNGEEMETAAIVTTRANLMLANIHPRMPVIVPPEAFELWLDSVRDDATMAAALIAPAPEDMLEMHEVSPAVNSAANDTPDLIEPATAKLTGAAEPKRKPKQDTRQGSLF